MRLSWSHKLFLWINAQVGKRRWLDLFMIFCARWLVYILALLVVVEGMLVLRGEVQWMFFVILGATLAAAYGTSLAIALIVPHRRPAKELPHIKTLVNTLGTWKSFPSDHTLWAFVLAFAVILFGAPWWLGAGLLISAGLIGIARVYTGVHYPRDILGAIVLAIVFSIGLYFVISYFS